MRENFKQLRASKLLISTLVANFFVVKNINSIQRHSN